MTADKIQEIFSRDSYWEEILKRDEPRKSECCRGELQTIMEAMDPRDVIELLHLGALKLKERA